MKIRKKNAFYSYCIDDTKLGKYGGDVQRGLHSEVTLLPAQGEECGWHWSFAVARAENSLRSSFCLHLVSLKKIRSQLSSPATLPFRRKQRSSQE